jgi:hypothetical protein
MSWDTIHGTALKERMNLEVPMGTNSIHSKNINHIEVEEVVEEVFEAPNTTTHKQ